MTSSAQPAARQVLAWTAAATIALLVIGLYLYGNAPRSGETAFAGLALAGVIAALPLARAAGFSWRDLGVYGAYAAALLIVWALRPTDTATAELGRQGLFFAAVLATAVAVRACAVGPFLLALHIVCAALVLLQIAGPRSGIDHLGRAGFYHALEQWSGYPEIGLLMAMGGAASAALTLAARRWTLRVAGALLAAAFGGATFFLQSRSASVTFAGVVLWLTVMAAARWRTRIGMLGALGLAASCVWVLTAGPGPAQLVQRAMAGVSRETQIRKQGWDAAKAMFREHPIAGVGLGGYRRDYLAKRLGEDAIHAYNIVLHVAAETGLLGLVPYLALWARVLWRSARAAGRSLDGVAALGVHALLTAFFVRSQSEHFLANLDTSFRLLLLVGVLVGMAEGLGRSRRPTSASVTAR